MERPGGQDDHLVRPGGAGRCGDRAARARVPPGHHRRPAASAADREPVRGGARGLRRRRGALPLHARRVHLQPGRKPGRPGAGPLTRRRLIAGCPEELSSLLLVPGAGTHRVAAGVPGRRHRRWAARQQHGRAGRRRGAGAAAAPLGHRHAAGRAAAGRRGGSGGARPAGRRWRRPAVRGDRVAGRSAGAAERDACGSWTANGHDRPHRSPTDHRPGVPPHRRST
jgi:hypothetical protein